MLFALETMLLINYICNHMNLKKYISVLLLTVVMVVFISIDLSSQCPMCRIAAESNLQNGGTEGAGLNKGILYMLAMPYILVFTLGLIWYKNRKKEDI